MENLISGFLKEELKRNRDSYNKEYLVAKRIYPGLNGTELAKFLKTLANQILDQSRAGESTQGSICARSFFNLALELVGKGYYPRYFDIFTIWQDILIAYKHILLEMPDAFPRYIFNALLKLSWVSPGAPMRWQRILLKLSGPQIDFVSLSQMGVIAAWRLGLAQFRELALSLTDKFDTGTLCVLLDLDGEIDARRLNDTILEMRDDPWMDPAKELPARVKENENKRKADLKIMCKVSNFRGFGGHFKTPPLVENMGNDILAFDEESTFLIKADIYGSFLSRIDLNKIRLQTTAKINLDTRVEKDGTIFFLGLQKVIPELAHASSFAASAQTLAVTVPFSHSIYLVSKN